jgi:hypothetical protein
MFSGLWAVIGLIWLSILATFIGLLWFLMYNLTPAVFLSFLAGGLCVLLFWSVFKGADIIYDMRRDKAESERSLANMTENASILQEQARVMATLGLAQSRQNRALLMTPTGPEEEPDVVTYGDELWAEDE